MAVQHQPLPQPPLQEARRPGLLALWLAHLGSILHDKGVALLLLGAPLLYGFFYPWFYAPEVVQRVPVALVLQDASGLSRQVQRFAQASPRIDPVLVTADEGRARAALARGQVQGYALVPPHFKRDVLRAAEVVVPVYANGAYPLAAKQVQYGFAEVFGTVSAGVQIRRLQAGGQSAGQAAASRAPVQLQAVALFNPTEGYGSFVVAAVAILILQQTLLMGSAMLVGTWRELGQEHAGTRQWLARLLALCTPGWLAGLFYFGWVFVLQDYPRGGNPLGALALLAVFTPAVAGLGCLVGWWLADREGAPQVLLFTSIPLAFLGGFTWPEQALPDLLQWLRWLSPSTAGIAASLRLNQAGAPLHAVLPHLLWLAALAVASWLAVLWLGRTRSAEYGSNQPQSLV
ncbi:ABC transporter permease [Melaminivora jejuensis]|uniref:ABC transporter permease n=1 Tax=Melaminivora jejuensis TaxID=1267217 RepID=UPI001AE0C4EF|nr:ABC transporter permease [Melaminivora jejuensis]UHJ64178.1 ABC transporter permease [Melaminivora jejuensis]